MYTHIFWESDVARLLLDADARPRARAEVRLARRENWVSTGQLLGERLSGWQGERSWL